MFPSKLAIVLYVKNKHKACGLPAANAAEKAFLIASTDR